MARVIVIGAGVGGLTTAAVLARAGLDVTVLEAQVYPGGCASTYFHQGYRFDAGATLAGGFYPDGPMDRVAQAAGITSWPTRPAEIAMRVHLPDGTQVTRHAGETNWEHYRQTFGSEALRFFHWQERTAEALWDLALRLPAWPPQSPSDLASVARTGLRWLIQKFPAHLSPSLLQDAFQPVAAHLRDAPESMRLFVDAQLLISAQATSEHTNALYGAAALDLPRRGVVHLAGGMGAIADTLVDAVTRHAGQVLYRQEVTRIHTQNGRPVAVETKRGDSYPADLVIANLTPWNVIPLLESNLPKTLRSLPARPAEGWGAFVVYAGMDGNHLPTDFPLHHQIIRQYPLGEGNSVFASLSPAWDESRAPAGQRAITLSTHTNLDSWWDLFEHDHPAYEARKNEMAEKMLSAAELAIPGLKGALHLVMPGTPVTFQRFTRRKFGWVGGFPQTGLLRNLAPKLATGLWLVGDSIFPGQSSAAVALGGLRVAGIVLRQLGMHKPVPANQRNMMQERL